MKRRAVVLGGADAKNPGLLLTTGNALWVNAGEFVAANPQLRLSKTPEQWLDMQYQMAGGDAAYEAAIAEQNPITHNRQVSTYSVNAATAQAMINNMSEALLGRMASDSELKKARAAVQKLLTATVTDTTTDATDPSNTRTTQHTKAGVGPSEAQALLEMRMKRGSEGMAMNVGQMFEQALSRM
jgi:dsRNA-specific ribonuclease